MPIGCVRAHPSEELLYSNMRSVNRRESSPCGRAHHPGPGPARGWVRASGGPVLADRPESGRDSGCPPLRRRNSETAASLNLPPLPVMGDSVSSLSQMFCVKVSGFGPCPLCWGHGPCGVFRGAELQYKPNCSTNVLSFLSLEGTDFLHRLHSCSAIPCAITNRLSLEGADFSKSSMRALPSRCVIANRLSLSLSLS